MTRLRPLFETVHLAALGVWVGALGMTAATAAVLFPEMRDLDPSLGAFGAYPGEHWVLAAGRVMARVFSVLDSVQIGCAALAALTAFALFVSRANRRWLRLVLTLAPTAVLVWYLLMVALPMHADLTGYWDAARGGELELASGFRAAFDARHPVASRAMGLTLALALVALVVNGWRSAASGPTKKPAP